MARPGYEGDGLLGRVGCTLRPASSCQTFSFAVDPDQCDVEPITGNYCVPDEITVEEHAQVAFFATGPRRDARS
eukprot:2756108-Rhodomonas_salina.1